MLAVTDETRSAESSDAPAALIFYAIRHRPTGNLLTLISNTRMVAQVEEGSSVNLFRLEVDRSIHVVNQPRRNPVFTCSNKEVVKSLLLGGSVQDGPNRLVRDALAQDLELVTLRAIVAEDIPIPLPPPEELPATSPVESQPEPWWRRRFR